MMRLKKLIIFYIYLKQEIKRSIKTEVLHKRIAAEEKPPKESLFPKRWFGRLVLRALVTSILVFFTIVYLHQGSLIFNADGSTVFNEMMFFELSATFFFLLAVFLVHRGISFLMNLRTMADLPSLVRGIIEALLVVVSSVILLFLTVLIPFYFIFPEIEVQPDRLRFNYIFMAIITLFFYYFVERESSKKQLQTEMLRSARLQKENFEAQLQNLKNQVNPHFLFNSLNVLSSLINRDQEKATEFVNRLSDMYRSFLDNSAKEIISLEQELEVVEAYKYLLKTRFGEAIDFKTDISVDTGNRFLPPGALQTLIENAVKHNGSTVKDPLLINIYTENDELVVVNKIRPRKFENRSTRTGLENLTNRYKYLTDKKPVFDKSDGQFTAKIPLLRI